MINNAYVNNKLDLQNFCNKAQKTGLIAIDLEFIPERTFYPVLALVQLAVGEQCVLIDPLSSLDLTPLDNVIIDPDIKKIVHAGKQDLGIFYNRIKKPPKNVFDTQIASAFLGFGLQISYANMVSSLLGVNLQKGESYTDWLRRPLSSRQEQYAIEDVLYLHSCYEKLSDKLSVLDRTSWVYEEFYFYEEESFYNSDPYNAYLKVKKGGALASKDREVLVELSAWREEEAKYRNRPRRKILSDELLVEIARKRPGSIKQLAEIRGMFGKDLSRYGLKIINSLNIAKNNPKSKIIKKSVSKKMTVENHVSVDFLQYCLRALCESEGLAPSYVGSKSDVESFVKQHLAGETNFENHNLFKGWRKKFIGTKLLDCLTGKTSVGIDPQSGTIKFYR